MAEVKMSEEMVELINLPPAPPTPAETDRPRPGWPFIGPRFDC